jgi:hypothetical protein
MFFWVKRAANASFRLPYDLLNVSACFLFRRNFLFIWHFFEIFVVLVYKHLASWQPRRSSVAETEDVARKLVHWDSEQWEPEHFAGLTSSRNEARNVA